MANPSDPLDRLPSWLKAAVVEIREAWRLVRAFVEELGRALITGLLAATAVAELLRKPIAATAVAAMVGGISPATGGLGLPWLSTSELTAWGPVAVLPAIIALIWFIGWSLSLLDREGSRDASRRQRERPQPEVPAQLNADARRLYELNRDLRLWGNLPNMEDLDFCHDTLVDTLRRIRARVGNRDVALALARCTKKKGFRLVASKGPIDRELRERLELGPLVEGGPDEALAERLQDLQYRHRVIDFIVGERPYLLIVVSGATIPEDVLAEVSEAAVMLMEDFVWAVRGRRELGEEA